MRCGAQRRVKARGPTLFQFHFFISATTYIPLPYIRGAVALARFASLRQQRGAIARPFELQDEELLPHPEQSLQLLAP